MSFWAAGLCGIMVCSVGSLAADVCYAQDLAPRAYIITPVHSNAITMTYSFFDGSLLFEGTIPLTGASARVSVSIFNYTHSLRLFGRTANFTGSLPYGIGNLRGTVVGAEAFAYRSGLLPVLREFGGRPRDEHGRIQEMAAKDYRRYQPQASSEDRPIRPDKTDQFRRQPLGFQTRAWPFSALGTLDSGCLRRSLALYHQPRILLPQSVLARHQHSDAKPHRFFRGSSQLRFQAAALGIA